MLLCFAFLILLLIIIRNARKYSTEEIRVAKHLFRVKNKHHPLLVDQGGREIRLDDWNQEPRGEFCVSVLI